MRHFSILLALTAMLIFGGQAAFAAQYTFKLAHNLPEPDSSYHRAALHFKAALEKYSDGKATIDIFPSGQLGTETNIAKKLQEGTFEFEILSVAKLGSFFPAIDIYALPFLFPDFDSVAKVVKSDEHKALMAEMEKASGLKTLSFIGSGFRNITNSKHPVNTPDDVKSLKMRVPQNRVEIAMFEALGASAVPVSDGELFTALQQGVVDGQDGSALWAYSKKIYEVQKYMSVTAHQLSCSSLIASAEVFGKLPADIQQAIVKAGADTETFWQADAKNENVVVIEQFRKSGMLVNEPDKKPFMDAMQVVYKQFADEVGGLEKIKKIQAIVTQ